MDRKITSGSLTLRPRWMEELLPWIGWLPLINFALPATHDSGAYRRFVPGDVPYEVDTIYSQEEDVYTQLLYGIRSFDFKTIVKTKGISRGCEKKKAMYLNFLRMRKLIYLIMVLQTPIQDLVFSIGSPGITKPPVICSMIYWLTFRASSLATQRSLCS